MKLIVGLGNTGSQYHATRHNVGFQVVDELAQRHKVGLTQTLSRGRDALARYGEWRSAGEAVRVIQPQTMMNASGDALDAAKDWGVPPSEILVVYDDVNLPLGALRARPNGGAGGHHGMLSCIEALGTEQIPRLRIGVGVEPVDPRRRGVLGPEGAKGAEPLPRDLTGFVLTEFGPSERPIIAQAVARAAEACEWWVRDGIQAMMNRANQQER